MLRSEVMRGERDPDAVLDHQVRMVLGLEQEIADALGWQMEHASAPAALRAELATMRHDCEMRAHDLRGCLRQPDLEHAAGTSAVTAMLSQVRSTASPADALCVTAAAYGLGASEYAVLTELSFRLFDPALRELAPRHLEAHARAISRLHSLLASAVVEELDDNGLDCRCICPMCSLGACGCTVAGRATIDEAWPASDTDHSDDPGLDITPPRRGSPLALGGARGGHRLVAIDGQPIATAGIDAVVEIQSAIRRHQLGEQFVVTIADALGETRELRVEHVSDY